MIGYLRQKNVHLIAQAQALWAFLLSMLFEDVYQTIATATTGEFRDRGSKFLAFAFPILTEQDTKEHLLALRKLHPKANHHCFAYRLGIDRNQYRASDDGEPAGSAGKPILNTLYSFEITNVLVVVVRYFGGTLLGVPGLINAYKAATTEALTVARLVEKTVNDVYELAFAFEQMNDVMKVVKQHELKIVSQLYDNQCMMTLQIRKSVLNQVLRKFEKFEGIYLHFLYTT